MGHPTVSVIMNCLNGATYLREALNSVFAQTYQDFEVIFWDDDSTDASVRIAKSYGKKVRCFYKWRDAGPAALPLGASRNFAVAKARGRYVAILDCDDTWEPNKLELQVDWMQKYPMYAGTGCDCWLIDAQGYRHGRFFGRCSYPDSFNPYRSLLKSRNFLAAPTLLFDRKRLMAFNPCYQFAELYDLCVRMIRSHSIAVSSDILASYRIHPGNRGGTGCLGMTKEVLDVMRRHRQGAPVAQYVREGLLWARYGWQTLTHS